jgi:hypothetical protein
MPRSPENPCLSDLELRRGYILLMESSDRQTAVEAAPSRKK